MRGRSRGRDSRALERGSEARAPCWGSKGTASPLRLASYTRFATRCGGRARANCRLARGATFLGSATVGKRPRRSDGKGNSHWIQCNERGSMKTLRAPRRHAVNLRQRVSVCTALHFLLQNRMPHRAQL